MNNDQIRPYLSNAYASEIQEKMDATPAGMAHWAGTGPEGAICGQCEEFRPFNEKWMPPAKPYRKSRCRRAARMCARNMAAFPGTTPACVKFEDRMSVTELTRDIALKEKALEGQKDRAKRIRIQQGIAAMKQRLENMRVVSA